MRLIGFLCGERGMAAAITATILAATSHRRSLGVGARQAGWPPLDRDAEGSDRGGERNAEGVPRVMPGI